MDTFPKTISEQANLALVNLARLGKWGKHIAITSNDYPVFYVEDIENGQRIMNHMINVLEEQGYIIRFRCNFHVDGISPLPTNKLKVTPKGFLRVEQILNPSKAEIPQSGSEETITTRLEACNRIYSGFEEQSVAIKLR